MCVVRVEERLVDTACPGGVSALVRAGIMLAADLARVAHFSVVGAHSRAAGLGSACFGLGESFAGPALVANLSTQVDRPLKPITHLAFMHPCLDLLIPTCCSEGLLSPTVLLVCWSGCVIVRLSPTMHAFFGSMATSTIAVWQGRLVGSCPEDELSPVLYALHPCCLLPRVHTGIVVALLLGQRAQPCAS